MLHKINKFCFSMTAWASATISVIAVLIHAHWVALISGLLCLAAIMLAEQYQQWLMDDKKEK